MARAAKTRRVFYIEEPIEGPEPALEVRQRDGLNVVVPRLPSRLNGDTNAVLRRLVSEFVARERISRPVLWYYTPMAVAWSDHLAHSAVVYDVMDELSNFRFAPADLKDLEHRLMRRADVVLTGGRQLFESRRGSHRNIHLFASSVDVAHFETARHGLAEPADQASIGRPRIGYFGVIDERIDLDLVRELAARHPDWQIVLVGPTAKIDPSDIPSAYNVHHLGPKSYQELPAYLGGWDVAIMPFALNDATRFISPTKTPEYLAGGRPVASTPITDVVEPYGNRGLVEIGEGSEGFTAAVERALNTDVSALRQRADRFLASMSWDTTWSRIASLIDEAASPMPTIAVAGRAARDPVQPAAESGALAAATSPSARGESAEAWN